MENSIQPFDFEGSTIRTLVRDGEPWFVANDVARVLGYSNPRDAVVRLVREGHRDDVGIPDAIGRTQKTTIISEPGLYSLILRSNMPDAVAFQDWVTEEVLPAIRKTGTYSVRTSVDPTAIAVVLRQNHEMTGQLIAAFEQQARRIDDHEVRIGSMEDDVKKIAGHSGYYTALGFLRVRNLPSSPKLTNQLGRVASRISDEEGAEIHRIPDSRFGTVGSYRVEILERALKEIVSDQPELDFPDSMMN